MPPVALSVVIPVHEGADFLSSSLPALAASRESDFECIVVDDGSSAPPELPDDPRFTLLRLASRGGPARARNHGASRAGADVLIFLDADVLVHADTLSRLRRRLSEGPDIAAVIGSYDDAPSDSGTVSQFKNLFHHYVHQHSRREATTFWSGCGAIRRDAFAEVGGFDARYERPSIEDIDLGYRLRQAGKRIALDPEIQVTHMKRWTLAEVIRTDMWARAVPWLLLMMRLRTMPADLNAAPAHRWSVAAVWALLACLTMLPFAPLPAAAAALAVGGLLLALNADLYRFFARVRGRRFAARAVALHWLYYAYCGLAVGVAAGLHLAGGAAPSASAEAADDRRRT